MLSKINNELNVIFSNEPVPINTLTRFNTVAAPPYDVLLTTFTVADVKTEVNTHQESRINILKTHYTGAE